MTFLGVSYRSNIADTRYSPVERFYKFCLKDGAQINLHDPYVSYWEELNLNINQDLLLILNNQIDILIVSTAHDEYKNSTFLINQLMKKDKLMILDSVGLFSQSEIDRLLTKHNLKVLGRGDI